MNKVVATISFIILVFVGRAQEGQPIELVTIDGEVFQLANFSDDQVIIDDPGGFEDDSIFKRKLLNGEKFTIEKRRISTLTKNGQLYNVFPDTDGEYHIGTFLSKGKINIFQTHVFRSIPSTQGYGGTYQTTLLYELIDGKIHSFGKSKKLKELMEECEDLKKYVKKNRIVKQDEYIHLAFDYYNDICGK